MKTNRFIALQSEIGLLSKLIINHEKRWRNAIDNGTDNYDFLASKNDLIDDYRKQVIELKQLLTKMEQCSNYENGCSTTPLTNKSSIGSFGKK